MAKPSKMQVMNSRLKWEGGKGRRSDCFAPGKHKPTTQGMLMLIGSGWSQSGRVGSREFGIGSCAEYLGLEEVEEKIYYSPIAFSNFCSTSSFERLVVSIMIAPKRSAWVFKKLSQFLIS